MKLDDESTLTSSIGVIECDLFDVRASVWVAFCAGPLVSPKRLHRGIVLSSSIGQRLDHHSVACVALREHPDAYRGRLVAFGERSYTRID